MNKLKDVTQLLRNNQQKHDALLSAYKCVKCEQGISDTEADLCNN